MQMVSECIESNIKEFIQYVICCLPILAAKHVSLQFQNEYQKCDIHKRLKEASESLQIFPESESPSVYNYISGSVGL